jgi:hypothetical protein
MEHTKAKGKIAQSEKNSRAGLENHPSNAQPQEQSTKVAGANSAACFAAR